MSPKIVAVGSPKGGVGKTTLAVLIAAMSGRAGHRTLLIDADGNLSAANRAAEAELESSIPGFTVADSEPGELHRLRQADSFDRIVIDLPGARGDDLAELVKPGAVDLFVAPTGTDRDEIRVLAGLLSEVVVPHLVVLTRTDPRWPGETEDYREQLSAPPFEWTVARTAVRRYKAWKAATDYGCLVTDLPATTRTPGAYADAICITREIEEALR